jgi:hypothetical protein
VSWCASSCKIECGGAFGPRLRSSNYAGGIDLPLTKASFCAAYPSRAQARRLTVQDALGDFSYQRVGQRLLVGAGQMRDALGIAQDHLVLI